MDGLNIAMKTACSKSIFCGIKIPTNRPMIYHLLYADYAISVGEWTHNNIKILARILRCFQISSGLKINFHKHRVIVVCVDENETKLKDSDLGCMVDTLPFVYFGVPIGDYMKRRKHWKPMIDKFQSNNQIGKSNPFYFETGSHWLK